MARFCTKQYSILFFRRFGRFRYIFGELSHMSAARAPLCKSLMKSAKINRFHGIWNEATPARSYGRARQRCTEASEKWKVQFPFSKRALSNRTIPCQTLPNLTKPYHTVATVTQPHPNATQHYPTLLNLTQCYPTSPKHDTTLLHRTKRYQTLLNHTQTLPKHYTTLLNLTKRYPTSHKRH